MKPAAHLQSAIELLTEIYSSSTPVDAGIHFYMRQRRYIGSGDRREILELVYGIVRHYWMLDGLLTLCWGNPGNDPVQKARRHLLAYLVKLNTTFDKNLFSGEVYAPKPLTQAEQALITKLADLDDRTLPEAAQLSCSPWVYELLRAQGPQTYHSLLTALNGTAPVDLRVNILKSSREKVLAKLRREGYACEPTPLSPWGIRLKERQPLRHHPLVQQGILEVQDEGAQLIALICGVHPGMAVWDYCAGAGGKTLALAALMENKGRILATDVSNWRLKNALGRLRRAGVHNTETKILDGGSGKWLKRQAGKFDCVLVDVPCSGLGTWRRNPELRWRIDESGFQELLLKQQEILTRASTLVKPGGRLVYATCSLLEPENRGQIATFLEKNPAFSLFPLTDEFAPEGVLDLNPVDHQTDGFFAAVLIKKEEGQ
jgi:16S rRNA (cytosine967-C5)-methyltransferase